MKIINTLALAAVAAGIAAPALAQQMDHDHGAPAATAAKADARATGTVKKIAGSTITIAHAPIASLGWPSMTMPFAVVDATQLAGIKAGDQVDFTLGKPAGKMVVTSITRK